MSSGKPKLGIGLVAGVVLARLFDPLITIFNLNVENWATRQKIHDLLPDADPNAWERLMSWVASVISDAVGAVAQAVNLAASSFGLGVATGAALVVFGPALWRALKAPPAIVRGLRQRHKNGLIPIRFLEPSPYSYMKDGLIRGLPHMAGEVAGYEKAVACRVVERGVAEYFWFWDYYLHRRYLWDTRGEAISLIWAVGTEPSETPRAVTQEEVQTVDPLSWANGRTQFRIWEAGCYLAGVPLTEYKRSSEAQSKANELIYYVKEGLINLAGETDNLRNRRIVTNQAPQIDEETYLSAATVTAIKKAGGLSSWLPVIDRLNRERRT